MTSKGEQKVLVGVRIRPLNGKEITAGDKNIWRSNCEEGLLQEEEENGELGKELVFDCLFDETFSTQDVFSKMAPGILSGVLRGYNGTIFAYGQTSSGKTHTLMGTDTEPGIITLAVQDVFASVKEMEDYEFLIKVSYIEIYNDQIKDLLSKTQDVKLRISNDQIRGPFIKGAVETIVRDIDAVFHLLATGEENRHVGSTNMNMRSSRSHTLFKLILESQQRPSVKDDGDASPRNTAIRFATLNLVDLAGSERQSKTNATGERLKEGNNINKSLLTLGNVISQLSKPGNRHIPYRDSKLTRLLQTSLGGNAKTAMITAISPALSNRDETKIALQFAKRAQCIVNRVSENVVAKVQSQMDEYYKNEIEVLKKQHLESQSSAGELKQLQEMIVSRSQLENTDKKAAAEMARQILELSMGQRRFSSIDVPKPPSLRQRRLTPTAMTSLKTIYALRSKIDEGDMDESDEDGSSNDSSSSDDDESSSDGRSNPSHTPYSGPTSPDSHKHGRFLSERLVMQANEMETLRYEGFKHTEECKERDSLLCSQLDEQQKVVNSMEMETESLQEELTSATKLNEDLKRDKVQLTEEKSVVQEEKETLQGTLMDTTATLEEERTDHLEKVQKLDDSFSEKSHEMIGLEKTIQELNVAMQTQRQTLRGEVECLMMDKEAVSQQWSSEVLKSNALSTEVEDLGQSLAQKEQDIGSMQESLSGAQSDLKLSDAQYQELEVQLQEERKDSEIRNSKLLKFEESRRIAVEEELRQSKEEMEQFSSQAEELQRKMEIDEENLSQKLLAFEEKHDNVVSELRLSSKQKENLQKELQESNDSFSTLEKEQRALQDELDRSTTAFETTRLELDSQKKEDTSQHIYQIQAKDEIIRQLKDQLQDVEETIMTQKEDMHNNARDSQLQVTELQSQIQQFMTENESLSVQYKATQERLHKAEDRLTTSAGEKKEAKLAHDEDVLQIEGLNVSLLETKELLSELSEKHRSGEVTLQQVRQALKEENIGTTTLQLLVHDLRVGLEKEKEQASALHSQLDTLTSTLQTNEVQLQDLQRQSTDMEMQRKSSTAENERMGVELNSTRGELEIQQQSVLVYAKKQHSLIGELDAAKETIDQYHETENVWETNRHVLELELRELNGHISMQTSENESLVQQVSNLMITASQFENVRKKIIKELEMEKDLNMGWKKKYAALENKLEEVTEALRTSGSNCVDMKSQLSAMTLTYQEESDTCNDLRQKLEVQKNKMVPKTNLEQVTANLDRIHARNLELSTTNAQLERSEEHYRSLFSDQDHVLNDKDLQLSSLRHDLDIAVREHASVVTTESLTRKELYANKETVMHLQGLVLQYEQQISTLDRDVDTKMQDVALREENIVGLKNQISENDTCRAEMQQLLSRMQHRVSELERDRGIHMLKMGGLQKQYDDKNRDLFHSTMHINELEAEVLEIQRQLAVEEAKAVEVHDESNVKVKKGSDYVLKTELNTVQETLTSTVRSLDNTNSINERLKSELMQTKTLLEKTELERTSFVKGIRKVQLELSQALDIRQVYAKSEKVLTAKLDEWKERASQLTSSLQVERESYTTLHDQFQDVRGQLLDRQNELFTLRSTTQELENREAHLVNMSRACEIDEEEYLATITTEREKALRLQEIVETLEQNVSDQSDKLDEQQKVLDEDNKTSTTSTQKVECLQTELDNLLQERNSLYECIEMQVNVENQDSSAPELNTKLKSVIELLSALKSRTFSTSSESESSESHSIHQQHIRDLRMHLEESLMENRRIAQCSLNESNEVQTFTYQVETLQEKMKELDMENEMLVTMLESAKVKSDKMSVELASQESEVLRSTEKINHLQQLYTKSQHDVQDTMMHSNEYRSDRLKLQERIRTLQCETTKYKTNLSSEMRQRDAMSEELESTKHALYQREKRDSGTSEEYRSQFLQLQTTKVHLKEQLTLADEEIKLSADTIRRLKSEGSNLREKLQLARENGVQLEESLDATQKQLWDASDKRVSISRQFEIPKREKKEDVQSPRANWRDQLQSKTRGLESKLYTELSDQKNQHTKIQSLRHQLYELQTTNSPKKSEATSPRRPTWDYSYSRYSPSPVAPTSPSILKHRHF